MIFLSVDEPETIMQLIKRYPEFESMYREVYEICRNMEDFMGIFSEELAILDKNTVDYMIDEMQNTIDDQQNTIEEQKETINVLKGSLESQRLYQEKLNRLIQRLIEDNRTEDLRYAAGDRELQEKLLSEYGLL